MARDGCRSWALVLLMMAPLLLGGCGRDTWARGALASPMPALAAAPTPQPSPIARRSSASPRPGSSATPTRAVWGQPFRVVAGQARGVATVVAFLQAYNAGQVDAALALLTDEVVGSDCDYRAGRVILFRGKEQAAAWLRDRVAEHDQLLLATIETLNPDLREGGPGAHVVAVTYTRRTSDALRARGFPDGITPPAGTKVVFTLTDDRMKVFANGPGGGPPDACQPSHGSP